jgi:predicted transcriptional regulator
VIRRLAVSDRANYEEQAVSGKTVHIDAQTADGQVMPMLKALANETRIAILRYLGDRVVPVNRIAADLGLPASTATMHVGILERGGLLHTEMRPAVRGLQKVCARTYDELVIGLPRGSRDHRLQWEQSMPVGAYSDSDVDPTCGLASATGLIGFLDDPSSFFEPDRQSAQLAWFHSGSLEYRFPNRVPSQARISGLQLSAEVCSEAPLHDPDWPSDISVWVNGVQRDAAHVGGINIFGRGFGNYPQDLVMTIDYERGGRAGGAAA